MGVPGTVEHLYRRMLTIRTLESRLQLLCDEGLAGDLHFNKGQEAIAVGACAALEPGDRVVTHHRTIAHQVAKGAELRPLVAELLGRRTGTNGGRAGEMHISDASIWHDFSFQLVGTCLPVAAGLAWALKNHHKRDRVVAVFFGDAASGSGQFHEGLSLIGIHKLPVLLVCENNHRAGNITREHYMPVPSVAERAGAYGISSSSGDGNDVKEVLWLAREALPSVREGRPHLIELDTERLCWHKQGQRDARTPDELAKASERDPLLACPPEVAAESRKIEAEVELAVQLALADPLPEY